ncbi:hypothetical protein BP00DRAFT_424987 [Aspergillus indologenus CBS 114.80]|uniref:Uncharacterized protein n=1 Tax=Aspergillus indologenus CBS 114.80 TaxID=1450541 RepID=A0A2V5I6M1_9EURO|nr:hypothetical protein BP00DRAFT_424987 [Aspergillus indologenus CBS 114.80]
MLMPETLILNLSVVVGTVLPASLVFAGLLPVHIGGSGVGLNQGWRIVLGWPSMVVTSFIWPDTGDFQRLIDLGWLANC